MSLKLTEALYPDKKAGILNYDKFGRKICEYNYPGNYEYKQVAFSVINREEVLEPIRKKLTKAGISFEEIQSSVNFGFNAEKYIGFYIPDEIEE